MRNTWWASPDQLIPEQADVIALPRERSYLLLGPPGSGKTNLLVLRANYLSLAGDVNLRVVVFTRTLQEFLSAGAGKYDFPSTKIVTSMRLQLSLLHEYGVPLSLPVDFKEQRTYLLRETEELIERNNLSAIYDAILLDEAQDYLPEEILVFRRLARTLFAAADARQRIYPHADSFATLEQAVDEVKQLRFHFRSGLAICRFADALARDSPGYQPLEATSNYDEGASPSSVEFHECGGVAAEAKLIIQRLDVQRKAYPEELIGIVCPTNEDTLQIWEVIQSSELAASAVLQSSEARMAFDSEAPIWVSTIHSFKGLEARALHVAGLARLHVFKFQRNLIYTAVTRAKTSLNLYSSGPVPGFVEKALQILKPPPPKPRVADAFGRR